MNFHVTFIFIFGRFLFIFLTADLYGHVTYHSEIYPEKHNIIHVYSVIQIWGTFHQVIPTGMSYLFYYTESTKVASALEGLSSSKHQYIAPMLWYNLLIFIGLTL